jgi:uncharacterized protein YjeT (DUF2065 family)
MSELLAALCLVAVFEGLMLFVAPGAWKRAVTQLLEMDEKRLRWMGGLLMLAGTVALVWVKR